MNYPKLKRFSHHLQVSFSRLNIICRCLYKIYAPDALKQRRNINRCKISDSSILAMLIWQASLGVESQRRFCEKLVNLSYYNAEDNRARSLAGFQDRLEVAVLAYNMAYCLERFN